MGGGVWHRPVQKTHRSARSLPLPAEPFQTPVQNNTAKKQILFLSAPVGL